MSSNKPCLKNSFSYSICNHIEKNGESDNDFQRKGKAIFTAKDKILHSAGNILQIVTLPTPVKNKVDDLNLNADKRDEDHIFAYATLGRGYSCYCFDAYLGRVAFSPRSTNPEIVIKSFQNRKELCTITGGASIEYADITFSRDGTRVAAVGKGTLDAKLWIWQLSDQQLHDNQSELKPHLIATHPLNVLASKCYFNPLRGDQICILPHFSDCDNSVIVCTIFCKHGSSKIDEKLYSISNNISNESKQTTQIQ